MTVSRIECGMFPSFCPTDLGLPGYAEAGNCYALEWCVAGSPLPCPPRNHPSCWRRTLLKKRERKKVRRPGWSVSRDPSHLGPNVSDIVAAGQLSSIYRSTVAGKLMTGMIAVPSEAASESGCELFDSCQKQPLFGTTPRYLTRQGYSRWGNDGPHRRSRKCHQPWALSFCFIVTHHSIQSIGGFIMVFAPLSPFKKWLRAWVIRQTHPIGSG